MIKNIPNLPMQLDQALAQNVDYINYFSKISNHEHKTNIKNSHTASARTDMQNYSKEISSYF